MPGPSLLWLVRHGQSLGNVADDAARRRHGNLVEVGVRDPDVELSSLGRKQAQSVGCLWRAHDEDKPEVVLSSPYVRALTTAQIALREAHLDLEIQHRRATAGAGSWSFRWPHFSRDQ